MSDSPSPEGRKHTRRSIRFSSTRERISFPELRFVDRFDFLAPGLLAFAMFSLGAAMQQWMPHLGVTGPQLVQPAGDTAQLAGRDAGDADTGLLRVKEADAMYAFSDGTSLYETDSNGMVTLGGNDYFVFEEEGNIMLRPVSISDLDRDGELDRDDLITLDDHMGSAYISRIGAGSAEVALVTTLYDLLKKYVEIRGDRPRFSCELIRTPFLG